MYSTTRRVEVVGRECMAMAYRTYVLSVQYLRMPFSLRTKGIVDSLSHTHTHTHRCIFLMVYTELKMAVHRIQIASNKKSALLKQSMREIALYVYHTARTLCCVVLENETLSLTHTHIHTAVFF
jgi:hypothetical protein